MLKAEIFRRSLFLFYFFIFFLSFILLAKLMIAASLLTTMCIRDLDLNLVKVTKWIFLSHFWPLYWPSNIFLGSLVNIWNWLKPKIMHNGQVKLVQIPDTHGTTAAAEATTTTATKSIWSQWYFSASALMDCKPLER